MKRKNVKITYRDFNNQFIHCPFFFRFCLILVCFFLLHFFSKGNEKKERESRLLSMSSSKHERAYKTMEALGYSQEAVEPVLKSLLNLYEQNWQHIEDEQYKVLVDAILEKQESKVGNSL